MGDFFVASHYKENLQTVALHKAIHCAVLTQEHIKRQSTNAQALAGMIERVEENARWAQKMADEGYHTVFSHVFFSLWAAQEAGIENSVMLLFLWPSSCCECAKSPVSVAAFALKSRN